MRVFKNIFFVFILVPMLLTACVSSSESLEASSWKLEKYRDAKGELVDVVPQGIVTISFQTEDLTGNAGCNSYSGSYEAKGNKISGGPFVSTMMACEPSLMQQEGASLQSLGLVQTYDIDGDSLSMQDANGEVLLSFVRQ